MAELSDSIFAAAFTIQKKLLLLIDQGRATEIALLERYGETAETISDLEDLQNTIERIRDSYTRLWTLLLRVAEFQPSADSVILDLLSKAIERADANADAAVGTIQETRRNWNLL